MEKEVLYTPLADDSDTYYQENDVLIPMGFDVSRAVKLQSLYHNLGLIKENVQMIEAILSDFYDKTTILLNDDDIPSEYIKLITHKKELYSSSYMAIVEVLKSIEIDVDYIQLEVYRDFKSFLKLFQSNT